MCWDNQWVDTNTMKQAVSKNRITAEEFKTITGQEYVA